MSDLLEHRTAREEPTGLGSTVEPRWTRPSVVALLLGTAALYLWNLTASGYANTFYSAAAQAGSRNWEAMLFGSSDAANVMTVDKPPVFLWPMDLSVRIFGLSSWSVLVPQVLLGVATVYFLYRIVDRHFGPAAGLIAGTVLALTPVAALMFRFDNPDAMLTFLLVVASWAMLRAVEDRGTRWVVATGVVMGFAFLTKDLAAMLILPALAATYLVAAPGRLRRRLGQLCAAGLAMIVSAGWWVALVQLLPAGSRPWTGGSTDNSFLSVVIGGNGLDRIVSGAIGPRTGSSAAAGIWRLFTGENAAQIGWLLPAALVLAVAGLVLVGRRPRTDPQRATLLLLGGWLVVSMAIYSVMTGIYHEYYTVSIAPPVAGLVGTGLVLGWRARDRAWVRVLLLAVAGGTGAWSFVLLGHNPRFVPWLRWAVLAATIAPACLFVVADRKALSRSGFGAVLVLVAVVGLAGPTSYVLQTVSIGHTGAMPMAGPAVTGGGGFVAVAGSLTTGRRGDLPADSATRSPGDATRRDSPAGGVIAGLGSMLESLGRMPSELRVSAPLESLLEVDAGSYTWVAAVTGAVNAASYQLTTEHPVIGIGGFNGGGAAPTLAQFETFVGNRQIHYYIDAPQGGGGLFRGLGADLPATRIEAWVGRHYTPTVVDGVTIYDLTVTAH